MTVAVEVEFGPGGSRQRPLGLASLLKSVDVTHLQQHARSVAPAIIFTFQITIEEGLLQRASIVRVEMRPMLEPVCLQPLFPRGGTHEPFKIAPGMQTLTAPIRG